MGNITRFRIYDCALSFFENSDFISNELLYRENMPSDMYSVFEHLQYEGLVKIQKNGIQITEKGKLKINSGGFVRAYFRRNIITFFTIIAAIASVISAIAIF